MGLHKEGPFPLPHNPYFMESALGEASWSVITINSTLAIDVTYEEATKVLNENITAPGICIVTSAAARRTEFEKNHGNN